MINKAAIEDNASSMCKLSNRGRSDNTASRVLHRASQHDQGATINPYVTLKSDLVERSVPDALRAPSLHWKGGV